VKRKARGIEPDPRPRISQNRVHTANFWKTIGSVHHWSMFPRPPRPGVVTEITSAAAKVKRTSFTT
jgi:hypothetical protein